MRILIVKTSSLGDIIHTFPVVGYLKEVYPQASIDWVVEAPFAELVCANPQVEKVLVIQTKKWRKAFWKKENRQAIGQFYRALRTQSYDLLFDLQGNTKSAFITAGAKARVKVGFGFRTVSEWPNLFVTHRRYSPPVGQNIRLDYLHIVEQAIPRKTVGNQASTILETSAEDRDQTAHLLSHSSLQKRKKVLVCAGSNWTNKQLSADALKDFLKCLEQQWAGSFIFVWGNEEEKKKAQSLQSHFPDTSQVSEKLSLPALQLLMSYVDLVISMDSLPLHLAGTTKTPSYSIFGPSSAHKYKPLGERHGAFQGSCPYGRSFEKRCPILRTCATGACIKSIQGEEVFGHFLAWWMKTHAAG